MTIRFGIIGLLIGILGLTVLTAAWRPDVRYSDQVAVLMYHHIHDEDTSSSTITSRRFRDQLTMLQSKGYHFITLDEFKRFMSGSAVSDNAVLVTFDDGYESFYSNALPILKELRIPAVNFVITGTLDHPGDDTPPKLTREEIRAMTSAEPDLIDVQCHTHAYHGKNDEGKALLLRNESETVEEYKARIKADMQKCISSLQPLASKPADSLAYPYGIYKDLTAVAVREAGIRYAFTIVPKMTTRGTDPMKIPRINAGSPGVTPENLVRTIERRIVKVR